MQETVEAFKAIGGGFQQLFDGLANGVPLYDVNKREIKIDGTHQMVKLCKYNM